MATIERIQHEIGPVFDERSRILMLGTMPSPRSREQGFFYGHPRNRFWKVMARVLDEPEPESIPQKKEMLLHHGVALWDVLAECAIEGASDASIRDAKPNDFSPITDVAHIQAVFCTGSKAAQLYRKLCEPETGIPCTQLPSTSPANAAISLEELEKEYALALHPYL